MSGDRCFITDQNATYHLTFTVVDWGDIFTRPDYKMILADSLNYCISHKNLEVYAWVLMTNHLHLVARVHPPFRMSDVILDFKKFTSKRLSESIIQLPESRREWLLHKFHYHAKVTGRAKEYKVWRDDNHAICLEGGSFIRQKIDYIHNNPIAAMIVSEAQDYLFSSASFYAGSKQTLVNVSRHDE